MKILIFEFDTRLDNIVINESINQNKKYADFHGYDFLFDNFKINDIHHDWEDLCIDEKNIFLLRLYYHRYELFEKYFNDYDYLVSFDSDIIVNNPLIKIEDLIDNEHDIFIAQDGCLLATTVWPLTIANVIKEYLTKNNLPYLKNPELELNNLNVYEVTVKKALNYIATNTNGLNCGFIIMKCSNIMKQFLNDFKRFYILFENCAYCQGCTPTLLRRKKYKDTLKLLPLGTQGIPNYGYPDFCYNEDKNFLCHPAGCNNKDQLLNLIDKIKNNKWWSQIK